MKKDKDYTYLIFRILSGKIPVQYNSQQFYIVQPDFSQLAHSELIYQESLSKSSLLGCLTYEQMLDELLYNDIWTPQYQKELDDIPQTISDIQIELYNAYVSFRKQDIIRKKLENLRKRATVLNEILNTHFVYTAEAIANSERLKMNIYYGLRDINNEKINISFPLINDSFLNNVTHQYINSRVDSLELREISKSQTWKLKWLNYKAISSFPINTSLMTDEQELLVMWSRYYDNILESTEVPPSVVIADNDMLDGWATLQMKKNEKEKSQIGTNTNAKEVFIVADTKEDAQRIHSMNDSYADMIRKQKLALVAKKGSIEDQHLPDSRREIISQAMENERKKMSNG
jgi:hypothetical protein